MVNERRPAKDRRRALLALAALAGTTIPGIRIEAAPVPTGVPQGRRLSQLIGSNGWPMSADEVRMWENMGMTWGRDSVGPGFVTPTIGSAQINKTCPSFDIDLRPILLRNNQSRINSLLMLGYTPPWNAVVADDDKSAPKNVSYWERYVETVVRTYSAPPFNLKYFQIWNEASGELSGGAPQGTFWHGPNYDDDPRKAKPYDNAMRDYVDRIHIPAARIIRKYHAHVVYGGWPDQGGLDTYCKWLEYRSAVHNSRMLDWVDYLDIHYLGLEDVETLYQRYVVKGQARGIWQTEIGDRYMEDPHFLPTYLFELAVWALDRNWDDPNKYVTMIFHWDGYESFRLTRRGPPRQYNVSGRSLIALHKTVSGALAPFAHTLRFDPDSHGKALYSGRSIVLQVSARPGSRAVDISGLDAPASGRFDIAFIDAISGAKNAGTNVAATWEAGALSIRFQVPRSTNGPADEAPRHLAYIVVTPRA
ncbi:hypothetical protein RI103_16000 [Paraburkholderia sp. FT54]|uniref:hypothetical protein n=1 Tax=Paraburkholderia sp. FT54 TaxID=3074437 RepID=UPI0028774AB2|nr:hypothetical protein [Paraburkholderia sp. FT54]WNC89172.1 hypothetical protein RI103_16000 [Paraburkholderia sp. FT54]